MQQILVVDDDAYFNKMLSAFLGKNGFAVHSALDAKKALDHISMSVPDLVLIDFKLPDLNGLELMELIKEKSPGQTMILMTNYSDVRTAVRSIQLGAFEFVTKPVNPDELLLTIQAALRQKTRKKEKGAELKKTSNKKKFIVGKSENARKLWEHVQLVAPTKMSVMILGESGTGKEYAARMIHEFSKRKDKPFLATDCGALSKELAGSALFGHVKGAFTGALQDKKGLFELADGGTLFLDEVGNLSYDIQVQLLRALQEQKIKRVGSEADIAVDVRILAATNEQLLSAIENNHFRLDLYHRLNEFEIMLKPLRERQEDMAEFIDFFIEKANTELDKKVIGVDEEVLEIFRNYSWPGNFRELGNIIRRAVLMCNASHIAKTHIPDAIVLENGLNQVATKLQVENKISESLDLKLLQEETEKEKIELALAKTKYNKTKTAAMLNIDRTTLYKKIAKYNIEA
ncbi:MAG: sigma-54-dependent Fis family transcriptional regulator [Cyclobacteriaceae bacterium]|nr:sigma-54-dependent Fis family transcriptional regulator [Cyclobacteriaceae bacterium]